MCDPRAVALASLIRQLDFILHVLQFYAFLIGLTCVYLVFVPPRRKH